jgi:hypothetical protein
MDKVVYGWQRRDSTCCRRQHNAAGGGNPSRVSGIQGTGRLRFRQHLLRDNQQGDERILGDSDFVKKILAQALVICF